MNIFTIGFSGKTAEEFFETINNKKIEILIDIRLNNTSQLTGFTKKKDLPYFLRKLCNCDYDHNINFAPTKEILNNYKQKIISWEEYQNQYNKLIENRKVEIEFNEIYSKYSRIILLCSEDTYKNCHRKLLSEYLNKKITCKINHI